MPREGKDPPIGFSLKRAKILQEMKDDVLLLLSEREVDMNVMAIDQPASSANGSTDIRPNEQNVNASTTAHGQPDSRTKSACALFCPFFVPRFPVLRSDDKAKAKDDAWAAATRFHNAYQETAVRVLEQRQKVKGKRRAGPEEDLQVSEQPTAFQGSRRRATLHRASWRRIRQASTILTATSGAGFVRKRGLACLLSCLTDASVHVVQTEELHTLVKLPSKLPASQKETSTDVSPISRIPSTCEPNAAQD
jgi:hypothetical protein